MLGKDFVYVFDRTTSRRKKGIPSFRNFDSHPGLMIMVTSPSRQLTWEPNRIHNSPSQFNPINTITDIH